jgi:hypothetical protein
MTHPCKEWRAQVARIQEKAEAVEAVAVARGLEGFAVRYSWLEPTLDDSVWGDSLEGFSKRVKATTEILGPPDSCGAEQWIGQIKEGQAPDLVARWKLDDKVGTQRVMVMVRSVRPRVCKVDPQAIYPECAAVLRGLEDEGGDDR